MTKQVRKAFVSESLIYGTLESFRRTGPERSSPADSPPEGAIPVRLSMAFAPCVSCAVRADPWFLCCFQFTKIATIQHWLPCPRLSIMHRGRVSDPHEIGTTADAGRILPYLSPLKYPVESLAVLLCWGLKVFLDFQCWNGWVGPSILWVLPEGTTAKGACSQQRHPSTRDRLELVGVFNSLWAPGGDSSEASLFSLSEIPLGTGPEACRGNLLTHLFTVFPVYFPTSRPRTPGICFCLNYFHSDTCHLLLGKSK